MDSSRDPSRSEAVRRHLRAIDSCFEPDAVDPALIEAPARVRPAGDDFARRQLDLFTHLIEEVGDADALWRLEATPLLDEPFDWSAVEPRDERFVREVLALSDPCCTAVFDIEFRTITRRILARVAARDPRPFRRSPHPARCAAALVWLAGQANGEFARRGRRTAGWLWAWFGVGNCSDRGRSLRRAAGLEPELGSWSEPLPLGDPALLHSRLRASLVEQRDRMLEIAGRRRTWSVVGDDGASARVEVRAATTKVVHAVKGVLAETGRATVLIGFGEQVEDAEFVALTVPDAHELVRWVQFAPRHLVAESRRVDRAGRRSRLRIHFPSPLSRSCCDVSAWIGGSFPLDTNICSYRVVGASSTSPVDDGPGEHDVRSAAPHDGAVAAARR
jgi:hypothetical protein